MRVSSRESVEKGLCGEMSESSPPKPVGSSDATSDGTHDCSCTDHKRAPRAVSPATARTEPQISQMMSSLPQRGSSVSETSSWTVWPERGPGACRDLPEPLAVAHAEPIRWDGGGSQPPFGCGTPETPPLEELLRTPVSPTPRRPQPETTEGKIKQVLGGMAAIEERRDFARQQIPQVNTSLQPCDPCEGLVATLDIPPAPVSPITIIYTYVPAAASVISSVWTYLYSAWFTVQTAWKSKRRIRHQWWYYRHQANHGWLHSTPWYWMGDYASAPEVDQKLLVLSRALTLACARMSGGVYMDTNYGLVNMVQTNEPYAKGVNDVTFYLPTMGIGESSASQIRVCAGWSNLPLHDQQISFMAALLSGEGTGVTNREIEQHLIAGSGIELGSQDDAALIYNAYNIAEWVKARYLEYHMHTGPTPSLANRWGKYWDLRPDNSWKAIFPARLGGGDADRPYSVWPENLAHHTQLKRAWDHAWCMIESGMRFLFKLSYMPEDQIEDMWNFGTGLKMTERSQFFEGDSRVRTRYYMVPENHYMVNPRSIPNEFYTGGYRAENWPRHPPSLRTWFGDYSRHRMLWVYYVMLARTLRGEGRWRRGGWDDLWEHFRIYAKEGDNSFETMAVSHLDGSTDLWNPFFHTSDLNRCYIIIHELFHYMITVAAQPGGCPRDRKSRTHCGDSRLDICYTQQACRNLASVNSQFALENINNYTFWLIYRWCRWGSDWPPECDGLVGETWHCDPIPDNEWNSHRYESVGDIGWDRLDVLEAMFGEEDFKAC